jgi:hypothetical protein
MPDYLYDVRVYVDVNLIPRGVAGTLLAQNNSNIGAMGPGAGTAAPGPAMQTMRFQMREMVQNAIATPPTAANIGAAITQAATDIQAQITAPVLATIQGWPTGAQ